MSARKVVYGLRHNVGTFNPLRITIMDWQNLWQKLRSAGSLRERVAAPGLEAGSLELQFETSFGAAASQQLDCS